MRSKSAYVLYRDPLVVAGSFGLIDDLPAGGPITVLFHPPWWLHPVGALRLKQKIQALRRRRPARVIVCANTWEELCFASAVGLEARWHNQNIHARERVFYPDSLQPGAQSYEAIYAAALEPYKRIGMARGVASLYVLTYKSGQTGGWDLHKEYPELATAKYNQQFLGEDAVRLLYSASDCGLALSRVEGAMWAAMEYMLCGLPVVSTRSFGGRDQFRDDYYWRTVASSPEAVAAGVRAWRKNPPDRQEVRRRVLAKVEEGRSRFAQFVVRTGSLGETAAAFQHRVWGGPEGITKIRVCPSELTGN